MRVDLPEKSGGDQSLYVPTSLDLGGSTPRALAKSSAIWLYQKQICHIQECHPTNPSTYFKFVGAETFGRVSNTIN